MSKRTNLAAVETEAVQADFDALAAITEADKPWTRRSFTPMFLKGRDYLKARFEAEGLTVRLDAAGNLIGRLEGSEPGVIMTGSHSDTVPSGGRFDGIAGIVCGLAAIRALKASGYKPRHTIELVDFLAEEPSEWGLSCVGSRGMAGALGSKEFALVGPDEELLDAAINRIGGDTAALGKPLRDDIRAFVEIHIEQGPVLEAEGLPIGIVTGIAGIGRLKVRFEGIAAHAGTAPMTMRQDAGLAAARFMLAVRDGARDLAGQGRGHFTATTGVAHLEPNGANVVPGGAEVIVDIRAEDDRAMDEFLAAAETMAREAADAEACTATVTRLSRTFAVPCDQHLRDTIADAAENLGLKTRPLASGAGHDAAFVARLAPAAMIFVPSKDGRSHCPEEWTDTAHFVSAANLLAETLMRLDQQ
ncbi:Zn-dependent hydrolase [Martelella alba]|uniref:Zn-dependent hydrolase n=1 Tax=Martelella alba TaxID=2590451 RepID=A0A506UEM1_9HYPH|nr:Zn-dependent hydrolase [Martelella alba]TPW31611.1 Zn-dependent hydrolase [Martelella alba]